MTLACIVSLALASCIGPKTRQPRPAARTAAPHQWSDYSELLENDDLTIADARIAALDEHTIEVSGRVQPVGYKCEVGQRYSETKRVMTRRAEGRWVQVDFGQRWEVTPARYGSSTTWTKRNDRIVERTWTPRTLQVQNPFGSDTTIAVQADGSFSAKVQLSDRYYTAPVPASRLPSKYFGSFKYGEDKRLGIAAVNPPDNLNLRAWGLPYTVRFVKPREEMVNGYVERMLTTVHLAVKDKVSHLPVSPEITVTCSQGASREDVIGRLSREFGDDDLAKSVAERIDDKYFFGKPGSKEEGPRQASTSGQSMSFCGIVGADYVIETVHGDYYYFRGVLEPDRAPVVRKNVLLIEKGAKVRLEEVKEGQGGVLTDGN